MKNIQKYLSALLALAMAAPVFTGCSDDYEYSLSSVVAKPSDKFNARIQFVNSCFMATLAKQGSHARGQQH